MIMKEAIVSPSLYHKDAHMDGLEDKLNLVMQQVCSIDYLLRNTLLGEEIVMHYICKAFLDKNDFVCQFISLLAGRISNASVMVINATRLMDIKLISAISPYVK